MSKKEIQVKAPINFTPDLVEALTDYFDETLPDGEWAVDIDDKKANPDSKFWFKYEVSSASPVCNLEVKDITFLICEHGAYTPSTDYVMTIQPLVTDDDEEDLDGDELDDEDAIDSDDDEECDFCIQCPGLVSIEEQAQQLALREYRAKVERDELNNIVTRRIIFGEVF